MSRYIDAEDLKAVIKANDWSNPVVPDVVGIIIDRTPSADVVEVRHGHWKYLWLDAVCSECGYINEADVATRCRTDPPYCPKCGAKMDGERSANE